MVGINEFDKLLNKNKYTRKKLASEMDVTVAAVSYWANGKRYPQLPTLKRLAIALDVTTDELIDVLIKVSESFG